MLAFFRTRRRNRQIVDALYDSVVEAARRPALFTRYRLPDTVMGRYESLGIHVFLVLTRCRGEPALAALSQDIVDRFMTDIEDSIRQIGIGDVAVPKRMRKLAGLFYARVARYAAAIAEGDAAALADVLGRDAADDGERLEAAPALAAYMLAASRRLADVPTEDILDGRLVIDGETGDAAR